MENYVLNLAKQAKQASYAIQQLSTQKKNEILNGIADGLIEEKERIFQENAKDVKKAKENNLDIALIDRLVINDRRLNSMADGLRRMASLDDPIGEIIGGWTSDDGLKISKVRVPIGVIGMVYESRPNVTVDAMGLAFKSGNAIILRGGSEAIHSNKILMKIIQEYGSVKGLPEGSAQLIDKTDRKYVADLVTLDDYLDVIVPRGGKGLKKKLSEMSTVPMIVTGAGLCHMFVDDPYDIDQAVELIINAKVQRPGVCNAIETLLVHEAMAKDLLPVVYQALIDHDVEVVGCEKSQAIVEDMAPATDEDFETEYHRLKISIKVVADVDQAIDHINYYSTHHSDAILTKNIENSEKFLNNVNSAAVYVNASTRFTDGGMFGFGGEIGISTQKLHARGPMGLKELTTYKYTIRGNGQIRK
jgi:glutamate-5-semialdehyde dehydrogenase